ncbi:hypothetical protein [Caballeronia sp. LZ019]|uniref:hypothetical protein n=1 Tax=Caballeronia sp. LZ019 TaxID=3038555 RepID=UPI0028673C3B|nr:hypothetical protein [Caballeronia sp. LZ019]MDR5807732.1 hypothetical protein [Caballeronia sp. LZ019]
MNNCMRRTLPVEVARPHRISRVAVSMACASQPERGKRQTNANALRAATVSSCRPAGNDKNGREAVGRRLRRLLRSQDERGGFSEYWLAQFRCSSIFELVKTAAREATGSAFRYTALRVSHIRAGTLDLSGSGTALGLARTFAPAHRAGFFLGAPGRGSACTALALQIIARNKVIAKYDATLEPVPRYPARAAPEKPLSASQNLRESRGS